MFCTGLATAEHSHTHVGRNADSVWGNADDNQLWIFATPDSPQWGTITMLPTGDYIGGKQVYEATLDCWHSAHPESGAFQLDFNDESTQPDWRLSLKRISVSTNFFIVDESTGTPVLTSDGSTFAFEEPDWDTELSNSNGGYGAWHFHTHTQFLALADGAGETFTATFTVIDTGSGYLESAPYTLTFVTVPEPTTLTLLGAGLVSIFRTRRK